MGWNYKDEHEAIADMKKTIEKLEKDYLVEVSVEDEEEETKIDTDDIWYKLISVDLDNITPGHDPVAILEQRVNKFIDEAEDNFRPCGAPVYANGILLQSLVDIDEL